MDPASAAPPSSKSDSESPGRACSGLLKGAGPRRHGLFRLSAAIGERLVGSSCTGWNATAVPSTRASLAGHITMAPLAFVCRKLCRAELCMVEPAARETNAGEWQKRPMHPPVARASSVLHVDEPAGPNIASN